jgi:hypothetical protein
MNRLIKISLCLFALIICCASSPAQRRGTQPIARPGIPPTRTAARPKWQIQTQTYSEDGQSVTLVSLQPLALAVPPGARYTMLFGVSYSYTGSSATNVKSILLTIFSHAPTCHFPSESSLDLRVNNVNATLPYHPDLKGADEVGWVSSDTEGGCCADSLGAFISPATLAKLAAATTLTGKIGDEGFQFNTDDLGALRDLASRVSLTHPPLRPIPGVRRR